MHFNFKKIYIFKVMVGTANFFIKFKCGSHIAEEHKLTAKNYVLNPGHAKKKK